MEKKKQKSNIIKDDNYYRIHPHILDLGSGNGVVRQRAREALAEIGSPAVSHLAELINSSSQMLRWEAVKALGQIADPGTAPLFISALYDEDEEVRWLAAEGLIAIDVHAVKPLLKELMGNAKSALLRKGAHHYFSEVSGLHDTSKYMDLLTALEDENAELNAPIAADKLLHEMNFKN
jgi:HEAT repeat protein